jgi:hypothetical protein
MSVSAGTARIMANGGTNVSQFSVSIDQISSVYSSVQPVKQKQSTESPKPAKNKNNNASNGNSKKQQAEAKKKEEKKPATIEEAVKKVSVPELKNLLETVRNRYPESPVLWLRDAAAYFNLALATDQPIQLAGKAFSEKPLSLLTKETRKTLTLLLEQISEAGRQSGFEALLANMTHEMAKGPILILLLHLDGEKRILFFIARSFCKRLPRAASTHVRDLPHARHLQHGKVQRAEELVSKQDQHRHGHVVGPRAGRA